MLTALRGLIKRRWGKTRPGKKVKKCKPDLYTNTQTPTPLPQGAVKSSVISPSSWLQVTGNTTNTWKQYIGVRAEAVDAHGSQQETGSEV